MEQFSVTRLLGVLFTPDLTIGNYIKMLNTIISLTGEKFDGQPTILPIPQDAPPDIPRLQLSSKDKNWGLNISLTRTDLLHVSDPFKDDEIDKIRGFTTLCSNFFSQYQESINLRVQRLAFVTDRVLRQNSPSDYIVEKFCRPELKQEGSPFNNTKSFELHSLKKYQWEGFNVNSWVRIKSAVGEPGKFPVVLLLNDINTSPKEEDPSKQFTSDDTKRFFGNITNHIKGIVDKYFPGSLLYASSSKSN
jgi:hypothetical protein